MTNASETSCMIDERCNLCGLCAEACAAGAIVLGSRRAEIANDELCGGCGLCEEICPQGAIECAFEIVWGRFEASASGSEGGANS